MGTQLQPSQLNSPGKDIESYFGFCAFNSYINQRAGTGISYKAIRRR